jgi:hypothetical protein
VTQRLVVLGASNVVRGFAALLRAAREAWGDPIEVMGALGVGRSYGLRSVVMGRSLPAIESCGLWAELARRPRLPTQALVADVGNDILYNVAVPTILQWVATSVDRLRDAGAAVTIAGLPRERLERLSRPGYVLLRAGLFPFHRWLPFAEGLARARALHEGLQALAQASRARFIALRPEWYGADPVHVRLAAREEAWRTILGAAPAAAPAVPPVPGPHPLRLWTAPPERQWILGRELRRTQPALQLPKGGSVSLY